MTERDELREKIDELIVDFADSLADWCEHDHKGTEPSSEELADRILELLPTMPKLEWRGTDLFLAELLVGFVDDFSPVEWGAYVGASPDRIDLVGPAEARAVVEKAVKEALGWSKR